MTAIQNILMVMGGSALGGGARYLLSMLIQQFNRSPFPAGTFIVNLLGCFLIGMLYAAHIRNPETGPGLKLLLATGFCGGFTTFSAFAVENLSLFREGNFGVSLAYAGSSLILGIAAAWAGSVIMK